MKRLVCWSVLAALAMAPASANAQRTFIVGAGVTLTTGDFADIDSVKTGRSIAGGIEFPFLTSSTSLRFDGSLSRMSRTTVYSETQHLASVNARLVLWVPITMASVKPYLVGGVGYLYNKYNPGQTANQPVSDSDVIFGGGVGSEVSVGPISLFVEGRYETGSTVKSIMPILFGLRLKPGS